MRNSGSTQGLPAGGPELSTGTGPVGMPQPGEGEARRRSLDGAPGWGAAP